MESTSILIATKTSLPPNLRGPVNGQVKLHVPYVKLQKTLSKTESLSVKTRWWGQNSFTIFKPLSHETSQKDLKTIAFYNVCCSLEMIFSYFKDMNHLKFEIVSNFGRAARRLGLAHVNLDNVKFGAPLAGLYPIKLDENIVGEIFVSLSLENFKTEPEKESFDEYETRPKVTSLRNDTNNVLNQILAKAKDLRSCLQATGGSHVYDSNNVGPKLSITQLLLEKNDSSFKKSSDLFCESLGCEEDSLPDDSVLNSLIYSSNNCVSRKESTQTQTKDFKSVKATLCKTVETQCDQDSAQTNLKYDQDNTRTNLNCDQDSARTNLNCDQDSTRTNLNCDQDSARINLYRDQDNARMNLNCKSNSTGDEGSSTEQLNAIESFGENLRNYSYIKVTVDTLNIESTYQNSGWIFSVELRIPWVGRDCAISWNNKGHRTYSDFSVFHLLSDKLKDGGVIFKQDRVLPYYYSPDLVGKQLSKSVQFIVEARNAHKRLMRSLGKTQIILSDVLKHNMKYERNLYLASDEMVTHNSNSIKIVVEFLKSSKKISPVECDISNIVETKYPLVVAKAPILANTKNQIRKPIVHESKSYARKYCRKDIHLETEKDSYQPQPSNIQKVEQILHDPNFNKSTVGNVEIILCIDRAFHLPIVYDSRRNLYFPPSTYVSCNLNDTLVSTNVISNSIQPVWNFTHTARMENQNFIVFKIHLARDEITDKDKILGFATVDIRPLFHHTDHLCNSYLINNEFGDDFGELKIYIWLLQSTSSDTNINAHLMCEEKLQNIKESRRAKSETGSAISSANSEKRMKVNDFLRKSVTSIKG